MDDKTRNEITESIGDAVSDTIAAQILNHNSKLDVDDTITSANYDILVDNDNIITFSFEVKIIKIK